MGGNTPRGPGLESVTERYSDVDVERKDSVVLLPKKSCPRGLADGRNCLLAMLQVEQGTDWPQGL